MPKSLFAALFAFVTLLLAFVALAPVHAQTSDGDSKTTAPTREASVAEIDPIEDLSMMVLLGAPGEQDEAIATLVERGNKDIVPTLVLFMRLSGNHIGIAKALKSFTGETITTWREAMLWQEAHPEIVPHASYRTIKLRFLENIDPNFMEFFDDAHTSRAQMKIRLEEITWGGVRVDGIPSLDNPNLIDADKADYLKPDDLVFGVEINGDVRAYPLRIMGWHEMFNDVIGGVPVALAYCTLCGAGILFETDLEGRDKPLVFGSSGFLYRSNKLMFDRETRSLWNQFTGAPVAGPLVDAGIKLKIRPVTITSWQRWHLEHPQTRVLSLETGHSRDYGSGVVYNDYFASPDLMFPTRVRDESRVKRKDYVFGIRAFGAAKAWPVEAFRKTPVINDQVGGTKVVLIGDAGTRTVRAYESNGLTFAAGSAGKVSGPDGSWLRTESFIIGPDGRKLARVPGHIAYWFAWDGYLGVESALYNG